MLWIWTATGKKQLINVKTLKCMEKQDNGKNVIMKQCTNKKNKQTLECIVKVNQTEIRWSPKVFLHLIQKQNYKYAAISKKNPNPPQQWSSKETRCKTSTAYKGVVC